MLAKWMLPLCLAAVAPSVLPAQTPTPDDSPIRSLDRITVFVRDYDEALKWYTQVLGLEKRDDVARPHGLRWLTVAPAGQPAPVIVLSHLREAPEEDRSGLVGRQALWVFSVNSCDAAYRTLQRRGVRFTHGVEHRGWGCQARFEDLYGNQFVLAGPAERNSTGSEPK